VFAATAASSARSGGGGGGGDGWFPDATHNTALKANAKATKAKAAKAKAAKTRAPPVDLNGADQGGFHIHSPHDHTESDRIVRPPKYDFNPGMTLEATMLLRDVQPRVAAYRDPCKATVGAIPDTGRFEGEIAEWENTHGPQVAVDVKAKRKRYKTWIERNQDRLSQFRPEFTRQSPAQVLRLMENEANGPALLRELSLKESRLNRGQGSDAVRGCITLTTSSSPRQPEHRDDPYMHSLSTSRTARREMQTGMYQGHATGGSQNFMFNRTKGRFYY